MPDVKAITQALHVCGALLAAAFFICTLIVSNTAGAGFNAVITAMMCCGYAFGCKLVVDKYATVLSLGFLIGTGGSLAFVMLTTGIYWGQLSQCTEAPGFDIPYYSCENIPAMRGVSTLAILLMVQQLAFSFVLQKHLPQFVEEGGGSKLSTQTEGYDASAYNVGPGGMVDLANAPPTTGMGYSGSDQAGAADL